MKLARVSRQVYSTAMGTFSTFWVVDTPFRSLYLELPWHDDKPLISCIPCGTYPLKLGAHHPGQPDEYPCYHILGLTAPYQRSNVEIHVANDISELEGCGAPGLGLGVNNGRWSVTSSRAAFTQFMQAMAGEDGEIQITDERAGLLP